MLSLVNTKKKNKKKRNPNLHKRTVVLGDIMKSKKFSSFDNLRRGANKALANMREDWLREVLATHGIVYAKDSLTKREVHESLSANAIRIERDTDNNKDVDKVYKEDVLIGEWNNERTIKIDFDGRLSVTIEYYIKPSDT